jgi:glycosyltransferase 2 family protein
MTRRQRVFVLLGLLISVLFLWRAFSGLQVTQVLEEVQRANPLLLLLGGGVYFAAMLFITWRWSFLLRSLVKVPISYLYQLVAIGYAGNNIYPFRSGEVLRIALLHRSHRVPVARLTTTVLVERVFDGIVMLTFVLVPLLFTENTSAEIRRVASVATPIFLFALAVFLILALRPGILRRLVNLIAGMFPDRIGERLQGIGEDVLVGLSGLRTPRDLAGAVVTSYISWMIEAVVYWIVALAIGLEVSYPIMLTVVGVVNLAGLIPASPGQIGVFEFFASRVLMGVGVPEMQAVAYALLVHLVIWLPPTLLGFSFLIRRGLGLSAVTHAREIEKLDSELPVETSVDQQEKRSTREVRVIP